MVTSHAVIAPLQKLFLCLVLWCNCISTNLHHSDNGEEAHHLQLFKSEGLRVLRTPFKVEMTEVLGSIQQRAKENNPNLSLK